MIRIIGDIPKEHFCLACSGGVDSMAILDFLVNGGYKPLVVYFNHGTAHGAEAEKFVRQQAKNYNLLCHVGNITREKHDDESQEEFWRNERYEFLHCLKSPVITAHHLDDVLEWWIFTTFHGNPKLIPYNYFNVIRPFLITPKSELQSWADRKNVEFIQDPSNNDISFMRNYVRHNIVSHSLIINPGIRKTLIKKIELNLINDF